MHGGRTLRGCMVQAQADMRAAGACMLWTGGRPRWGRVLTCDARALFAVGSSGPERDATTARLSRGRDALGFHDAV